MFLKWVEAKSMVCQACQRNAPEFKAYLKPPRTKLTKRNTVWGACSGIMSGLTWYISVWEQLASRRVCENTWNGQICVSLETSLFCVFHDFAFKLTAGKVPSTDTREKLWNEGTSHKANLLVNLVCVNRCCIMLDFQCWKSVSNRVAVKKKTWYKQKCVARVMRLLCCVCSTK